MFQRFKNGRGRRGVAATELAVCLPPLLLLVIASIEFANMIFLNHSLSIAAYEAARHAAPKQAANTEVTDCVSEILSNRGVTGSDRCVDTYGYYHRSTWRVHHRDDLGQLCRQREDSSFVVLPRTCDDIQCHDGPRRYITAIHTLRCLQT